MSAPCISAPFPRLFLAEAFADLRPDLSPAVIEALVDRVIETVLHCPADELPADAFLP